MALSTRADERLVELIWERQAFDTQALRALDMAVVFRGMPSDAGGPDYQQAVVSESRRKVLTGDVEFHVLASDWYRHGHHQDARYNKVILHVVWTDDLGVTECHDGSTVPILALGDLVDEEAIAAHHLDSGRLLPHPCVRAYRRLTASSLLEAVRILGVERFHERSARFSSDLLAQPADQVLYTGLLEALGYASNRDVFRELADVAPYSWLVSVPVERRCAALLDAARLAGPSGVEVPARVDPDRWRLSRIRPANHPARRLEGIAWLLAKLGPSPAASISHRVRCAIGPIDVRRALMTPDGLIGAGRADEVAVSVVLPFVFAFDESSPAEALYVRYPSPPANRWTRSMQAMFSQAGHGIRPKNAAEHQGMHHLYHRFCRYERFASCPVCGPGRAEKWD